MKFMLIRRCSLVLVATFFWSVCTSADIGTIPIRDTPRPLTTDSIPHVQINVEAIPNLSEQLLHQMAQVPGVDLRDTIVGRSGSTGFWLKGGIKLLRSDSMIRGREFAHLHPDGSLHASLPEALATRAVAAGWATPHPWATDRPGMEGFVMIYTPLTEEDLGVVIQLVMESYRFVTGKDPSIPR